MTEQLKGLTAVELFEKIVQLMIKESVRFATECKNKPTTTISLDDIKLFIGVLLISGYHKLPAET